MREGRSILSLPSADKMSIKTSEEKWLLFAQSERQKACRVSLARIPLSARFIPCILIAYAYAGSTNSGKFST